MKASTFVTPLIVLGLILNGCGKKATPTLSIEATLNQINTEVAVTFTAQAGKSIATDTLTPSPTLTITSQATPTQISTTTPTMVVGTPTIALSGGSSCDNSTYVSDVTIPDGKVMLPGESFTKTWSMKNTGTCEWTKSYSIAYAGGFVMNGSATKLDAEVSPGKSGQISVKLVAPAKAGTYTGYWRLMNAAGIFFGETVWVQIVVSRDAVTVTPTPTITATSRTPTSTSGFAVTNTTTPTTGLTASITPTSTTAPTVTPTATPTNSPEPTVTPTDTSEPTLEPTVTPTTG